MGVNPRQFMGLQAPGRRERGEYSAVSAGADSFDLLRHAPNDKLQNQHLPSSLGGHVHCALDGAAIIHSHCSVARLDNGTGACAAVRSNACGGATQSQSNSAPLTLPSDAPARLALSDAVPHVAEGDPHPTSVSSRMSVTGKAGVDARLTVDAGHHPRSERVDPPAPLIRLVQVAPHLGSGALPRRQSVGPRAARRRDQSLNRPVHQPRLLSGWNMRPATDQHTLNLKATVQ